MKRISIFLILLVAFLRLSAFVKHSYTLTSFTSEGRSDSTILPAIVLHPESLRMCITMNYTDSQFKTHSDSIKSSIPTQSLQIVRDQLKLYTLDSLKLLVKSSTNGSLKAVIYIEIGNRYLNYDTVSNDRRPLNYQNEALSYTMMALHRYSACNDTLGLRISYDNLAKIYFLQKKYAQAKWFILQSNTLSRTKGDVVNIIASLFTLSAIKSEIRDYKLAMDDLDEALQLSIKHHYPMLQSEVLKNYALLYSRLHNYPKEALMLKKRDSLDESIRKKEEARLLAKVALQDSIQKRRLDSVQNKKKLYFSNTRKLYKNSSPRKTTSL